MRNVGLATVRIKRLWADKDVRLAVKREYVELLSKVQAHDVVYVKDLDLKRELERTFYETVNGTVGCRYEALLLIKHEQYAYEEEVRLLTFLPDNKGSSTDDGLRKFGVHALRRALIPRAADVSFAGIGGFIDSVSLNPNASAELEASLIKFCEEHQLKYSGRAMC